MTSTLEHESSKGKMGATWQFKDPATWTWYPPDSKPAPVHEKTAPVPAYPPMEQHKWIAPRALAPIYLHRVLFEFGVRMPWYAAFVYYSLAFLAFGDSMFKMLRRMGKKYGFFDGAVPRDGIPDVYTNKVAWSLVGVLFLRPLVATMWVYDANAPPGVSLWAPLQVSLFLVVLDYWFYIYHRSMHECKPLWFIHRLHHTTKHPNAMLGAFADNIQEWGDILLIPVLTWMVVPLDFHTWYLTTCYQAYTEAAGHSGIRLYWLVPATSWLRIFDAELAMEDHDLHHRLGNGRRSFNYGKQTRLWDKIFGTSRSRIESFEENIDFVNVARTC
ncbi:hypothetical protein FA09DRAFT_335115 [Tilletiopsis washingtonensis]|uniref:Fatty acid hydroxylase domain-containing protein n=1 Tax=Tilletiopsis washingtonensis TaxID=58919 RepID=A0A316Z3C5_9BASI|nr:hypothetical protein FA09DRAFT_335115 [Tilletiopsis washingtonensis]PWN96089.1 hypothetical protein FA09DRAFT_335115 [Tilletiopsis washingtonensis]